MSRPKRVGVESRPKGVGSVFEPKRFGSVSGPNRVGFWVRQCPNPKGLGVGVWVCPCPDPMGLGRCPGPRGWGPWLDLRGLRFGSESAPRGVGGWEWVRVRTQGVRVRGRTQAS